MVYEYNNSISIKKYVILIQNTIMVWYINIINVCLIVNFIGCQYNNGMLTQKYGMLIQNTMMIWYVKTIVVYSYGMSIQ